MRRALLASLMVGLVAPAVGVFLVQRRLSLLGAGLGHVALTGVAVGMLTATNPVWAALVAAVLGAVLIELVRARGRTSGDVALAVLFYGGIAGGVVLLALTPRGQETNLDSYLFGAITTTSPQDVAVFAAISVVVLATVALLGQRLYAVSDDEEYARAVGLPVLGLNVVLAALVAATVVLSMRVVGLLLISAHDRAQRDRAGAGPQLPRDGRAGLRGRAGGQRGRYGHVLLHRDAVQGHHRAAVHRAVPARHRCRSAPRGDGPSLAPA